MAAQVIENPLLTFTDRNGQPLSSGYVYFGEPDQDPRAAPVGVFYDEAMTTPAAQPLRTTAGYIYRNGAPSRVWVDGSYSTLVLDSVQRQVFYSPNWAAGSAANVAFDVDAVYPEGTIGEGVSFFFRSIQPLKKYLPASVDYDAIEAGTSTEDVRSYILTALASTNKLELPNGQIAVSDELDLRTLNSVALVGSGTGRWSGAGNSSVVGTRILHTGTNKKGFRLAGQPHVEAVALEYSAQQAAASTAAMGWEFNGIVRHPIFRDVLTSRANINYGIDQSITATIFDGLLEGLQSWSASGTHMDFRNVGGGTNTKLVRPYVNGAGSLDFVTPGQAADYAVRFANGYEYTVEALSVDGLRINQVGIDTQNGQYNIEDARFEACTFLADTGRVINQMGGFNDMHVGSLALQNTRWAPSVATAFYLYSTRATVTRLLADMTYIKSDCDLGASGTRRILFNSALLSAGSRVDIGSVHDDGVRLTDTTAWIDSGTVSREMPVFTFNGRTVKEYLQGGRIGNRPLIEHLNALPVDGARDAGDQIFLTLTTPDGKPYQYSVIAAGTPGTFRATAWVIGKGATGARPVLTTSDVGVPYLDTTLDPDGKIIWWTGTAWVDATGAVV